MTKSHAKQLQRDYIPGGRRVSSEELRGMKFRRTREEDEIYQCGMVTGFDPQSTYIYCGEVAEWMAISEDEVLALCNRSDHAPRLDQREEDLPLITLEIPDGPIIVFPA